MSIYRLRILEDLSNVRQAVVEVLDKLELPIVVDG
jgi:hypothetical protein